MSPPQHLVPTRRDVVRGHIGFDGLLLSDDLNMQALGGSLGDRASRALAAGCDIALHCNGVLAEMKEVAGRAGEMSSAASKRFAAGRAALARQRDPMPKAEALRRFSALLPEWG